MEFKEGLTEASGERGRRLGYSAFGTCQFSGKAGKEVVLGLFGRKNRYGRKHAERVCGKEYNVLRCRSCRNRTNDILDVVYRVRNTGVLRNALIREIYLAVLVQSYVLEKCVTFNCVVDIGFGVFVEVDNFCIATAFKVEYAVVIPTMFVISDEEAFRVGRKRRLARAGKSEEDRRVLSVHVGICRAVHRGNAFER